MLHLLPIDFLPMPNVIDGNRLLLFIDRVCVSTWRLTKPKPAMQPMPNVRGRQVEVSGQAFGEAKADSFTCRECPAQALVRF